MNCVAILTVLYRRIIMEISMCKKRCKKKYKWNFKVRKVINAQIDRYFEIENSNFKLKEHNYNVGVK